jgi:hypothetical protein
MGNTKLSSMFKDSVIYFKITLYNNVTRSVGPVTYVTGKYVVWILFETPCNVLWRLPRAVALRPAVRNIARRSTGLLGPCNMLYHNQHGQHCCAAQTAWREIKCFGRGRFVKAGVCSKKVARKLASTYEKLWSLHFVPKTNLFSKFYFSVRK